MKNDHHRKIKERDLSKSSIQYSNDKNFKNLDKNNKKIFNDDENFKQNNETLHEKHKKNVGFCKK